MTRSPPRICLITPAHVASNPRLVKNAAALAAAGYRVHVVSCRHFPPVDPLDQGLFASAQWTHTLVDCHRTPAALVRKLLRRIARRLVGHPSFSTLSVAARTHHAEAPHLGAVAAGFPANLYLGHCLAGLPAAAAAARARAVPYGFDAEDFHDSETTEALADRRERTARRLLQSALLPGCAHLTAASPLISRQYQESYGVTPRTVLNVFPLSEAPPAPIDPGPVSAGRPARFYWFSQTIGPGRGLENVLRVLARMHTPVELHLRGFGAGDYVAHLQSHATAVGLARPIAFHAPARPTEMARLAAGADLGLSSEESHPLNHDLCLSNKVFTYLLAGLPVVVSPTSAQEAFAAEVGSAALLCDFDRPDEVALMLDGYFADPARVTAARRAAWDLSRSRYNWDIEQKILLDSVRTVVGPPS
jgi:glycosyltransferase involved in cell wall biosynthesis